MRKSLAIVAIVAIVIIFSCSKKYSSTSDLVTGPSMGQPVVINATVVAQKTFTFTLGNSGSANILKQAAHFQVSEASVDGNGNLVYTYIPASNFLGSDEVSITYDSNGANTSGCSSGNSESSHTSAWYLIKFNVSDN